MNVQSVSLNSANVRYNNANEESRVYDIESNVNIQGQNVTGFEGGVVKKEELVLATFNQWNNQNQNIGWQNVTTDEKCEIQKHIDAFVEAVKTSVSIKTIEL